MNYLNTGTIIAAAIVVTLIITLLCWREAWRRGVQHAHAQMGNIRADYANALEEQEGQHLEEIRQLNIEHRMAVRKLHDQNQLERDKATALEADYARLHDQMAQELEALRSRNLSATEVQLLSDAAGKLRIASPALHAQQQFASGRQTKELASRLETLVNRLRPAAEAQESAA